MTITDALLKNGFTKVDYNDYNCMMRIHVLHYLFWSENLKHFGIGVLNDSQKKEARGFFRQWNIVMIPKPIYSINSAFKFIKALTKI